MLGCLPIHQFFPPAPSPPYDIWYIMYVSIYIYICICIYVYIYIYMYIHIYISIYHPPTSSPNDTGEWPKPINLHIINKRCIYRISLSSYIYIHGYKDINILIKTWLKAQGSRQKQWAYLLHFLVRNERAGLILGKGKISRGHEHPRS